MRRISVAMLLGLAGSLALPMPAASQEDRESYLARMRTICEGGCLQPKQVLRTARKLRPGEEREIAAILDIADVTKHGDKYILLQQTPNLYDMTEFDFGMPQLDQSRISDRNNISIEMNEQTLFDLLNLPQVSDEPVARPDLGSGITVEGDRNRKFVRPSLATLRVAFRNRRIVVRAMPRLDVAFAGARRDRKNKQLTLMLRNADDLALLPRYDGDGNPILDGPLQGLAGSERGER
ncbi:hypothetical protein J3454_12220 [Erythrobacter sp. NFXS35]|uniref:hypothetical protein n=1 Tax=Erythrobacter sp. NFXS35 TaxID=2818436 RepID=UPI0032DE6F50